VRSEAEQLLARLTAADEPSLRSIIAPTVAREGSTARVEALDRRVCALVRLAALLAIGAPTTCLRWAVDLAVSTGATADAITEVLASTAALAGTAQTVSSAPRLALALGFDIELDGWDGS
jgi:alkylhydroperoxidase/carboxymuconolactone decarboxylase family protein YurZ